MEDPSCYLEWLLEETRSVKVKGIQSGAAHQFPIEEIYVPLTTANRDMGRKPISLADSLRHRKLIVQGDAGSGKSTFIRHVAYQHCVDRSKGFPLYIRIAELEQHIRNTIGRKQEEPATLEHPKWIAHFLASLDKGLSRVFFEEKLKLADTVVLLDGLDETPNVLSRNRMAALFLNAATHYNACRFVVTTRPQSYRDDSRLSGFQEVTIAPFGDEEIGQFLTRWCGCLHPGNAEAAKARREELSEALHARDEIKEMAANPVMLTALCVIHFNGQRMPEQRAELYEAILGWLAGAR